MNFKGKIVCVTGAGGSIGTELCVQLYDQGVKEMRLVSISEGALYNVNKTLNKFRKGPKLVSLLGSVTDPKFMADAVEGCEAVFHAAAHKHVPLCEQNPLAAIDNNVRGTYTAARAASHARVPYFVLVSSDKAVKPCSIMGATKRAAELMLMSLFNGDDTEYKIVRFGNVLDSAGSVLPFWREQIASGGPITMTDPDCLRYFMTIPDAVELILESVDQPGHGPFIFDMGEPYRMGDMAKNLMKQMKKKVPVKVVGLRQGEKLVEELSYGENTCMTFHPKIKRVVEEWESMYLCDAYWLFAEVDKRDADSAVIQLQRIVGWNS